MLNYFFRRVIARAFKNSYTVTRDQVIAIVIGFLIVLVTAPLERDWHKWITTLKAMGIFFVGFGLWHYLKAQWEIHKEDARTIKELRDREEPIFHPSEDLKGKAIECAFWGLPGEQPIDVTLGVEKRLAEGERFYVNYEKLGLKENVLDGTKFLTVVLSVTQKEADYISLPGWKGTTRLPFAIGKQIETQSPESTKHENSNPLPSQE